jgi:hypothetical protein
MGLLGPLDTLPNVHDFKAVVARGVAPRDSGSLVCFVGQILQSDVDDAGLSCIDDLNIPAPPPGMILSVYEGKDHWHDGSYEHPDDGEWSREGTYRELTPAEWSAVMAGRNPWLKPVRDLLPSALAILSERKGCHCEHRQQVGKVHLTFVEVVGESRWEATGEGTTLVDALVDLGTTLEVRRRPEGIGLKKLLDETDFGPNTPAET